MRAEALLRYDGDDSDELDEDGQRLADSVLAHAVTATDAGPVAIAGPWATGPPAVVNPSYWMPGVATQLAGLTDDDRWRHLAEASVSLLRDATHGGAVLPTDWARLDGSVLEPGGAPDGSAPAQYGPDAQRVPIFLASGCVDGAADLAKAWWHRLSEDGASAATVLSPDGAVIDGDSSPLAMLAAAAAARAAGEDGRARDLTARAEERARSTPTYYGDAWVALAAGLADGSLLSC